MMLILLSIVILSPSILSEKILLPSTTRTNQSFSSIYLCHVHQLNNSDELFLRNYQILTGGNTSHIHHLLLYECSIKEKVYYSGLCGIYNARLMPELVYRHCQTRIIIAWAKGGQLNYTYPNNTGLKFDADTKFLLEIHIESSMSLSHPIGLQLEFYPQSEKPSYEIGVLTLGTLAESPLYLPPRLDSIRFPTYCFNDCLKSHLRTNLSLNIFSILVHAHRRAVRITLDDNRFHRLIDRNPFEFHRQENIFFPQPYPQIDSTNELSLTCYYSTRHDYSNAIHGGYHSENEMCQAFLYYYPKIPSFPLCLSLPIYKTKYLITNWTTEQSLLIKEELESNVHHLSMCGDNLYVNQTNQTMLEMKIYRRSMRNFSLISFHSSSSFLLIFLSVSCCYFITKKHLHSFSNGGTL